MYKYQLIYYYFFKEIKRINMNDNICKCESERVKTNMYKAKKNIEDTVRILIGNGILHSDEMVNEFKNHYRHIKKYTGDCKHDNDIYLKIFVKNMFDRFNYHEFKDKIIMLYGNNMIVVDAINKLLDFYYDISNECFSEQDNNRYTEIILNENICNKNECNCLFCKEDRLSRIFKKIR